MATVQQNYFLRYSRLSWVYPLLFFCCSLSLMVLVKGSASAVYLSSSLNIKCPFHISCFNKKKRKKEGELFQLLLKTLCLHLYHLNIQRTTLSPAHCYWGSRGLPSTSKFKMGCMLSVPLCDITGFWEYQSFFLHTCSPTREWRRYPILLLFLLCQEMQLSDTLQDNLSIHSLSFPSSVVWCIYSKWCCSFHADI